MCITITNLKLGHFIRKSRLTNYCKHFNPLLVNSSHNHSFNQHRKISLQSTVESLVTTQVGFIKSLSESSLVNYSQKFLIYVHDTTGLPWWATIVCTTVLLRTTVTFPLAVYQYYILAKLENIKLEMPAIANEMKKEMAVAIKIYNWDERTAQISYKRSLRKQWTKLIERDNCHPLKTTILLLVQIPMWISLSIALRNFVYMLPTPTLDAEVTFIELTVGGFGFIRNLTVVDSSYIFPVILGIINLAIIEFQSLSRVEPPSRPARIITNLFRGFSILMIPIAASVPSCLVIYWTTSSVFGLTQNLLLLSPKIKRFCKIPKTTKELQQPYEHIAQELVQKCNKFKLINKIK